MASSIIFSNAYVSLFPPGSLRQAEPGSIPITHGDPVAPILIALMLIVLGAMVGGLLMRRFGQPAVLGELLVGMLVANVAFYFHRPTITILREGGSILTLVHTALTHNVSLGEAATQVLPSTEGTRRPWAQRRNALPVRGPETATRTTACPGSASKEKSRTQQEARDYKPRQVALRALTFPSGKMRFRMLLDVRHPGRDRA